LRSGTGMYKGEIDKSERMGVDKGEKGEKERKKKDLGKKPSQKGGLSDTMDDLSHLVVKRDKGGKTYRPC